MSNPTPSPTNADGELRTAFLKAGFQIVDNRKVAKQTSLVITEQEFERVASVLQATRAQAVIEAKDAAYEDARTHLYTASQIRQALFKVLRLKTGRMMIDAIL